jgi:hypothetical protein
VQSWLLQQAGSGSVVLEKVHLESSFFRNFFIGYLQSPKEYHARMGCVYFLLLTLLAQGNVMVFYPGVKSLPHVKEAKFSCVFTFRP